MKSKLTSDQKKVWKSCKGKAGSLTLLQHTNFHDIAKRHGLLPVAMRVGDDLLPFDEALYRRAVREGQRQKNDTYAMTFYDGRDCAAATGSPTANWTTWARVALGIKGSPTTSDYIVLSATNPKHDSIRQVLIASRGAVKATPIISATMVVFYIASQKRWSDPGLYYKVVEKMKSKLEKLNVIVLRSENTPALPPDDASDIDVDDLLAQGAAAQVAADKDSKIMDDALVDALADAGLPTIKPDLVVNEPTIVEVLDATALADLDDDEYEAVRSDVMARMAKAEAIRRERKIKAVYEKCEIATREQWIGKPYDSYVTLRYADGSEHKFKHIDYGKSPQPTLPPFIPPDMQA